MPEWLTSSWMWFWTWFGDHNGGIAAAAAIVAVAFAAWGIVNAKRDSRDRTRPVVLAEFQFAPDSDTTFLLVVTNVGHSVARKLRVSFDPPVGESDPTSMAPRLRRRYAGTIPLLAPGQELANIWWSGHQVAGHAELVNEIPTPDEVTVTIEYDDEHGRQYREQIPLTVDSMLLTTFAVSSSSIKGCMRTLAAQLTKISNATTTISRSVQQQATEEGGCS